ncbi:ABC transporter permease [uncultured Kiloniella sp.]|uniref:ABC transporter permease n=1 Tax=uncultured Kiloniella sp. TaxID=1133091 RepID=UPI002612B9D2|nr:ABC transporter permease [uncultured Kiloniella sp.]
MNLISFMGAIELGLIYGLIALAVFLSFRILDFPDLTIDGSFPLGAAVCATMIVSGCNPVLATVIAFFAGGMAGLVTAFLNLRFKILNLLASILTMIALYSINLRIMGRPNVPIITEETILTSFEGQGLPGYYLKPIIAAIIVFIVAIIVARFLNSDYGLAMRSTGANQKMARAQGIDTNKTTYIGMALSNALVGLAGALFAQMNGFADITIGTGTIVIGLAALIAGEAIFSTRGMLMAVLACIFGSIVYRIAIGLALNADSIGLEPSDLNLVTALLVTIALILPGAKNPLKKLMKRGH